MDAMVWCPHFSYIVFIMYVYGPDCRMIMGSLVCYSCIKHALMYVCSIVGSNFCNFTTVHHHNGVEV